MIIPEWGCIIINNGNLQAKDQLQNIISSAIAQLLNLQKLSWPSENFLDANSLNRWTLIRFLNYNIAHSAKASFSYLVSLVKLLDAIELSDIPNDLIQLTKQSLELMIAALKQSNWSLSCKLIGMSRLYSEASFFHPSLLGRLYFPNEHKFAVYLPLLLPITLPILVGCLKLAIGRIRSK